jgi:MFS family permease
MRSILRDRNFRLLAIGQTLSAFGDYAMLLALGVWAKELTGSNAAAGLTILPFALPALFGPALGVVVDRFPRRRVMIVADLSAAAAEIPLVFVNGREDMWILYLCSFALGTIVTIYQAARSGLLVSMLDEGELGDANGVLQATNQGMRLVAPLAGAGLFAWLGGPAVALLDATTFVVSAAFLAAVRSPDIQRREDVLQLWTEIKQGVRHIVRTDDLRRLTVGTAFILLLFGCTEVLVFALLDGLDQPATFLGVLSSIQGVGAIAGGLIAGWTLRRLGEIRTVAWACAGAGVGMAVFGTAIMPLVIAACLGFGVVVTLYLVAYQTLMQRLTPAELQGRVGAALEAVVTGPYVLSIALGAVLVTVIPFQITYAITGAGALVIALYFWRSGSALKDDGDLVREGEAA